jgi:hypothetical protein
MSELAKMITDTSIGAVAVAALIIILFYLLRDARAVRKDNKEMFGKLVELSDKFTGAVDNHMDTNTRATELNTETLHKLADVIARLCRMWDNGKK